MAPVGQEIHLPLPQPTIGDERGAATVQQNVDALAALFRRGVNAGDVLVWDGNRFDAVPPGPTLAQILAAVYPVGSIYVATVSTSPATLFGFGTWSAFGPGRTLVSLDAGQTEFDVVEETGGVKTVTLTAQQSGLRGHNHTQDPHNHVQDGHAHGPGTYNVELTVVGNTTATGGSNRATGASSPDATPAVHGNSGSATATNQAATATNQAAADSDAPNAHNNLQPYIVVYMWKRTA
jgi:microcystin-dependent protein